MSSPDPRIENGGLAGIRAGVGLDGRETFISTSGEGDFGSSSISQFTLSMPLFVGVQGAFGSFTSDNLWDGFLLGFDYSPRVILTPSMDFAPLAFTLRFATMSYQPTSVDNGIRTHFTVNLEIVPAVHVPTAYFGLAVGLLWQ